MKSNNITIVTAFYDIGRQNWKSYGRTNEEYFKCFELLCQLKNKIVVFTQSKFKNKFDNIIKTIKKDLIVFYDDDIINDQYYIDKISEIQKSPDYLNGILTVDCPEYWNPYYVFVNFLKSKFCLEAINKLSKIDNTISWIDFGYVKKQEQIPESKLWNYYFEDKIHMWNIKDIPEYLNLIEIIKMNTVYIQGCHIVASKNKWIIMNKLMEKQIKYLLNKNLIDDDQTLMLMSYLNEPHHFKIHREYLNSKDLDWFFIFQYYNDKCDENRKIEMESRK